MARPWFSHRARWPPDSGSGLSRAARLGPAGWWTQSKKRGDEGVIGVAGMGDEEAVGDGPLGGGSARTIVESYAMESSETEAFQWCSKIPLGRGALGNGLRGCHTNETNPD